jgi:plasmid stabilization system protein ParE
MIPEFHPAAQEELTAAVKTGEERAARLGHDLLQEVRRVVGMLCASPEIGKPLGTSYRRFPLRRFPFALVYRIDGERLRIIAMAHRRRRPGYWRRRK